MKDRKTPDELDRILLNPSAIYDLPAQVVADEQLTKEAKIEVLRRWEYDACELSVAGDEGMQASGGELLQLITSALRSLSVEIDTEHTPPTKQGGLDRSAIRPKGSK